MLYGYKKDLTTVVGAADDVIELEAWYQSIMDGDVEHSQSHRATDFMDLVSNPDFNGYRHPAYIFDHADEGERDAFLQKHSVKVLPRMQVKDAMFDMVAQVDESLQSAYGKRDSRTIAELEGIDQDDPWDKRSAQEKAAADDDKKRTDELRKRLGDHVTGSSFDPNPRSGAVDGLNITEIFDAGGAVQVKGRKFGPGQNAPAPQNKAEKQNTKYDLSDSQLDDLVNDLLEVGYTAEQLAKLKTQFDLTDNEHRQALADVVVDELKTKKVNKALLPIEGVTDRDEILTTVETKLSGIKELSAEEREKLLEGVQKKLDAPTPKPGDYRFTLNEKLTAEPALRGAGTPIFSFGNYKFGPNDGQFTLSDLGLLFPPGDDFDLVSGGIFEYTGTGTAEDATAELIKRGFLEDPSVIPAEGWHLKKRDGSEPLPTPEDFARALGGDGTSTVDGTDSWGKHAVGIKSHPELETIEPGIKGEVGAVLGITDGLVNTKGEDLDPLIKNAIGKDLFDLEAMGKQLKIGKYNGMAISGDQYIFPESPDYQIRNEICGNVNDHGGVTLGNVKVRIFTRSNEYYRGVVVYEGTKDVLIVVI